MLLLGLAYLWPWAVRKKAKRLENQRHAKQMGATHKPRTTALDIQLIFPVRGRGIEDIISFFGDPREQGRRRHEGVDIAAPRGAPVLAVADGLVERVQAGGNGGKQVWLRLDNDWLVYYAHLHTQSVAAGARVTAGDVIGSVGNTGNARLAGPHLHFCLYPEKNKPVDPLRYLPGQLRLP